MSYIDHFADFLFDERRRLSSKAAAILFLILAVLLVDNLLGFSYSFSVDKKIAQVQKLNTIITDPTIDSSTKKFALNLRSKVIERQDIVSQSVSFFRSKSKNSAKSVTDKTPTSSMRDNFWFNLTASGLYFVIAIAMIPLMLLDKTTSILQRLGTGVVMTIALILFGVFFIWILGFIPQISNSTWFWNYLLNAFIQALMTLFLFYVGQKNQQ